MVGIDRIGERRAGPHEPMRVPGGTNLPMQTFFHGVTRKQPMFRTLIVSLMLAGGIASMAAPRAEAQSPDPALLAPGSSRAMLMPRPGIPHTGVAPRPTIHTHAEVMSRRSGLASQSHARR
jgi:hypothetical protein